MKKIFCDCCSREFAYGTRDMEPFTREKNVYVGGRLLNVKMTVISADLKNGEHADICADCRWKAVMTTDVRDKPKPSIG